jgi:sugar lactone lactonase YvrE
MTIRGAFLGLWLLVLLSMVPFAFAFSNGQAASLVIGQPSFTTGPAVTSSTGLYDPDGVTFDKSGNLWVADLSNNRVLEYTTPLSTHEAASIVIGQPDFTTANAATTSTSLYAPQSVAFDKSGDLWVADFQDNRVLEYKAPFVTHETALLAIGQPDFGLGTPASTSTGLDGPHGITFDASGDLWVADFGYNRVLEYTPPFATHEAASLVIGQPNFTATGAATTSTGLRNPAGVVFDSSGNLWVSDYLNNRILEYTTPLSTGEAASLVIGQPDLTTGTATTTSTGLYLPYGITFDASGNLWVADSSNNRIFEYTTPFSTHEAASLVIGQSSFTTISPATSSTGLSGPFGITFDTTGNLWVGDYQSNRVLEFSGAMATTTTSSTSAQTTSTSSAVSTTTTPSTTTSPTATTTSTNPTTASSTSTTTSTTSPAGGGIPEFPYQFLAVAVFTFLILASYLLVRHHGLYDG